MYQRNVRYVAALAVCLVLSAALASAQTAQPVANEGPRFEVSFSKEVSSKPYTGRVYVALTTNRRGDAIGMMPAFAGGPYYARDVKDWPPGQPLEFTSENCLGYPDKLAKLPPGAYRVQAIIDLNGWSRSPLRGPGNGYSPAVPFTHPDDVATPVRLEITQTFPASEPTDTDAVKYVRLKSKLLSEFHKRDVYLRAAVGLPLVYTDEPQRRFPTVYTIPGFGGTLEDAAPQMISNMLAIAGLDAVVVHLDANCPTGHHVFADSANNGPWGQALITELIPYLEREFRLIRDPDARYVTGHSSGGWSSLWLQITYPDAFGGTWSTSPDPVDFTAFQIVDIYAADANMFYEPDGSPRPISRKDFMDRIMAKDLSDREWVLGRGGQMGSFEAVFGPRGPDGKPALLWDRQTGKIDPKVAEAWRKYDIRYIVETNWKTLGPKLKGKLHLFCGDKDTYYLERAFFKLRDALQRLGSDAYIEVIPGASHMLPPTIYNKIARQMADQFDRWRVERRGE